MRISVVICTYNRAALLSESIAAIASQDFPSHDFEVLVVDNNSTDNTRRIVEDLSCNSIVDIRYLFECRQGLSFARNTGVEHSKGEIVAFVDDDIDANEGWLGAIVAAFSSPDVACAGGPIRPVWLIERPAWLTEEWYAYLSVSEFESARSRGEFIGPDYPWGANIAFRRSVLDEVGGFPTNLGRIGYNLLSGEEVALCMKIEEQGGRIAFAPDAVIHHKIQPERLSKRWYYRRTYWQGRSQAVLDSSNPARISRALRRYASVLAKGFNSPNRKSFDSRCYRRLGIGYLHQAFLCLYGVTVAKEYKPLRALIQSFEGASTGMTVLREKDEALVAIQNSLSWRITRPIRLVLDVVTGSVRRN